MSNITQIIADDKELSKLLIRAFKWEGRPYSVAKEISKMRKLLWERYGIDLEILT